MTTKESWLESFFFMGKQITAHKTREWCWTIQAISFLVHSNRSISSSLTLFQTSFLLMSLGIPFRLRKSFCNDLYGVVGYLSSNLKCPFYNSISSVIHFNGDKSPIIPTRNQYLDLSWTPDLLSQNVYVDGSYDHTFREFCGRSQ
jgi:hypothetical protein